MHGSALRDASRSRCSGSSPPHPALPIPSQAGHTRNEKRKPYKRLRTPHGETFQFTGDARKRIPRALLDRIQALNALDEELWRAGEQILTVRCLVGCWA